MKHTDIVCKLHEQLRNLDVTWIKRLLISIVGEHQDCFNTNGTWECPPAHEGIPIDLGKDAYGTVIMLADIIEPPHACHGHILAPLAHTP